MTITGSIFLDQDAN
ncbi:protein of unknown function [Brevefilum fermentans]|uniref:Uncharacterized protein n=1 Tax=Candidatus Brevifilum fermentans TaxID=1986204 RepID=A0A1Y6K4B3_9CHLR|nr:protein of unknown function [Brevefilum fermentans]